MPSSPLLPKSEATVLLEYVTFMRACNFSARTVKARQTFASARLRGWGLAGFTTEACLSYLAELNRLLEDEETSEWTVSTYHAHLRNFGQWLALAGYVERDPTAGIPQVRRPKSVPNPLSDVEVERVLTVAAGDVRDYILMGLYLGLRAHEIAKFKGEHVRDSGVYVRGKGGTKAVLPITPPIRRMIERRHEERGYWFPGNENGHIPGQQVSLAVGRLYAGMGIDGASHRNRHFFGTMLARQGVHITKIKELMRHASIATTQGYLQVAEADLQDAVLLLPDFDEPPLPV